MVLIMFLNYPAFLNKLSKWGGTVFPLKIQNFCFHGPTNYHAVHWLQTHVQKQIDRWGVEHVWKWII